MAEKELRSTAPRTVDQTESKPKGASTPNKTKPVTEEEKSEVTKPSVKQTPKPDPGCWAYIGPTIRGRVMYGAVFSSAGEAKEKLAAELEACPALSGLLVALPELPEARLEVKVPGTARYVQAAQVRADLMKH